MSTDGHQLVKDCGYESDLEADIDLHGQRDRQRVHVEEVDHTCVGIPDCDALDEAVDKLNRGLLHPVCGLPLIGCIGLRAFREQSRRVRGGRHCCP